MRQLSFGYAGKWSTSLPAVQQAAQLVKNNPTPVGVETFAQPGMPPVYRVATNQEYYQAAQGGRLVFTAFA